MILKMKSSFTCVVAGVFLKLCISLSGFCLVEATVRNERENLHFSDNLSSEQIFLKNEINPKFADEHHYYLPQQTVFGSSVLSTSDGVFVTSPPHLLINPAPIQSEPEQSTSAIYQNLPADDDCVTSSLSHCILETPSFTIESELLTSENCIKDSIILAGHIEVPSKTSSENDASAMSNIVSQPSIALQGTKVHAQAGTF
ncbi:uncharacterized protein LOC118184002 [Stegodyphus dumicola]|uniref:uncharacterized protein LOC118184002 n=1 Tax=Stegodyphus dumicola TaxID=202533 RepID=UPI0015ADB2E6|nr:uncharacterized protein LOC118184002 [Stegodyphus dumicola]